MTGQGDRNFERIKKAKASDKVLDVSKAYQTVNGCKVRALRVERTNKVVVGAKVITVANYRLIVCGEVYSQNRWLPADWDANGKHVQEEYSLVERKASSVQSSLLF